MFPSADQAARAIIAAAAETFADPLEVTSSSTERCMRARMYAVIALRKAFPDCPMPAIGRMLGSSHPPYVSIVYAKATKGAFKWFDWEALQRVVAAAGPILPVRAKTAQARPAAPAHSHPAPKAPTPAPDFLLARPYRPPGPPTKGELRDMLRAAVENTAKLPGQN